MSTLNVGTIKSLDANPPVFKNSSGVEKGQLAKAWIRFNGEGTVSITDSFNISSMSDNGVGTYAFAFANNMANANYVVVTDSARHSHAGMGTSHYTTSVFNFFNSSVFGVLEDRPILHAVVFGD